MYRRAQGLAAPLLAVQILIVGLALPWRQLGVVTTTLILATAALAILQAFATPSRRPRRDPPAIEDLATPETDRPSRAEDQGAPDALQRSRRQAAEALDALCGSGEDGPGGTAPAIEALGRTADEVSRAAMRVSTEATSASVAAEDVRHDLAAVMEASREFFDTISQIGAHAASSAAMGVAAFGKAEATSTNVDELLVASQRIGEMTGLVASIARQTNLLALNATIEAARAGEHGRGFAVVAAEVKALAGESAKAASSIADMATLIYGTTERAIGSIQAIAAAIGGLNEATKAIATAVEERVHAAASMTGSVERVTANIDHVANAVARIETAADETLQGAGFIRRRATDVEARSATIEARVGLCADLLAPLAAADRSPQAADAPRDPASPPRSPVQLPRGFR